MTVRAMLFMAFTCRANPRGFTNPAILNAFIGEQLMNLSPHTADLGCKADADGDKRKGGPLRGPPVVACNIAGSEKKGGLGSSHTTPCGGAVPARPPTRHSKEYASRLSASMDQRSH